MELQSLIIMYSVDFNNWKFEFETPIARYSTRCAKKDQDHSWKYGIYLMMKWFGFGNWEKCFGTPPVKIEEFLENKAENMVYFKLCKRISEE